MVCLNPTYTDHAFWFLYMLNNHDVTKEEKKQQLIMRETAICRCSKIVKYLQQLHIIYERGCKSAGCKYS